MSATSGLGSARIMSVNMDGVYSPMAPTTANGVSYFNPPAPPMYGEDEVPMSVQLPSASVHAPSQQQQQQQVAMMSPMPPQITAAASAMVITPTQPQSQAQASVWDTSSQTPIPSSTPVAASIDEDDSTPMGTPRGVKRSRSVEEGVNVNDNTNANVFDESDFVA